MKVHFSQRKGDWILALLYVNRRKPVRGTLRIMKELFLFKKEAKLDERAKLGQFYRFVPYDYGPCSFEIYDDLNMLRKIGSIIALERPDKHYQTYMLTQSGEYRARLFLKSLHPSVTEGLEEIKRRFNDLPLYSLLSYVYEEYPEYAKKSVFAPF